MGDERRGAGRAAPRGFFPSSLPPPSLPPSAPMAGDEPQTLKTLSTLDRRGARGDAGPLKGPRRVRAAAELNATPEASTRRGGGRSARMQALAGVGARGGAAGGGQRADPATPRLFPSPPGPL